MTTQPGDDTAAGKAGRAHLRASHADREHVIEMLKAAYVRGMLTKDELDARVSQALASRTYADLAALTAGIPPAPAPARPARPVARARRRPLLKAVGQSGSCLIIGFASAVLGGTVLDPNGPGPHPYHSWAGLTLLVALMAILAAVGILANGAVTSWEQRRSRRQLPPRPGPGSHALDGQRRGGTGRGPVPPGHGDGQAHAGLRSHKPRQHIPLRVGRAPRGARPAPGAV